MSKSNLPKSDKTDYIISIHHREKIYEVSYKNFSSKSSYKEVIGLPHSFKLSINATLQPISVGSLINHINTGKTTELIDEQNVIDLNFLAHLYNFYFLEEATGPFLLSRISVSKLFHFFDNRKEVEGYIESFLYYFYHNFDTFVIDPSFYSLPFNIISNMLEQNVSKLTVNDLVQFTINTYYFHGQKSLEFLAKSTQCKSTIVEDFSSSSFNTNQNQNINDLLFKMIDDFGVEEKNKKKEKRSRSKLFENECSTELLIKLFSTICYDRPYPYLQYVCSILKKRKKLLPSVNPKAEMEKEIRLDISTVYIALLETTQGNKNAAYILLVSLFESGKLSFLKDGRKIAMLYTNLSQVPPPGQEKQKGGISFNFSDVIRNSSHSDSRLTREDFDWGAHGFFVLYRIFHEGLYENIRDERRAQTYLRKAADRGYSEAFFSLANFYLDASSYMNITEETLEILRRAADFGNCNYQIVYAISISTRKDKHRNLLMAAHYFKLAMLNGHPDGKRHFDAIQCKNNNQTLSKCTKLFAKINEKTELPKKLSMLKLMSECGFVRSISLYTKLLNDLDCSPLNKERLISQEMKNIELSYYYKLEMKRKTKSIHFRYSLFLIKNAKTAEDFEKALKVLHAGVTNLSSESLTFYAILLLRLFGPSYRSITAGLSYLNSASINNFFPALKELSCFYLYGILDDFSYVNRQLALNSLQRMYNLKDAVGSSRYLYMLINDPSSTSKQVSSYIDELKKIADLFQQPADIDFRNNSYALPTYLYAKVLLEGKATESNFKMALNYLNKASEFVPSQILIVALSFQFGSIVKNLLPFKIPLFSLSSPYKSEIPLPKNFDSSSLPPPSVVSSLIEKFASLGDPTFRYKQGSILLDQDDECGFELIRQSAFSGSICGMMKYGLLRLENKYRPVNEFEAMEMFKRAGINGLEIGLIMYAHLAMKYPELRDECITLLKSIQSVPFSEQINFVTSHHYGYFNVNKLNLIIGKLFCLKHLFSSLINEYEHQQLELQNQQQHENSKNQQQQQQQENSKNSTNENKISKEEYAEALFYYAKSFELSSSSDYALNYYLKSYENGYKPAIEALFSLQMRMSRFNEAINILLDNLSMSTFALYKIGSMTLFERPSVSTQIAESQAVDFIKLATLLEDSGNYPDAIWKFGTMLRDGFFVAKDETSALEHFYRASEHGCTNAVVAIGHCALNAANRAAKSMINEVSNETQSVAANNYSVAFNCFKNASQSNSREGKWCYSMCLLNGIGCKQNISDAVSNLRVLAATGDSDAAYKLGKIALNAALSKPSVYGQHLFELGIHHLKSAALLGNSTAIWRLGLLILQDKCNPDIAIDFFSNDQNFDPSVASSELVAAMLFKKSAEAGNKRGASLFSLCLENGIGVDRDLKLARLYASSISPSH